MEATSWPRPVGRPCLCRKGRPLRPPSESSGPWPTADSASASSSTRPNLKEDLIANQIDLVILAVPSAPAQKIVDEVVAAGVKGILSFAPTHIDAPPNVYVRSEDMSMELEYLTYALVNQPDK